MDTEVPRGVVKEAYDFIWYLLESDDAFAELVPPENRIRYVLDEKTQPDMRANTKYPAVHVFPSAFRTNYTLSSDHIEVVMVVDVLANVTKLQVEDLLKLYEIVILAVDRWRTSTLRPETVRRIEADTGDASQTKTYPLGWVLVARFALRLVLTRSKEM